MTPLEYAKYQRDKYGALMQKGAFKEDDVNRGIIIGKYSAFSEMIGIMESKK